MKRIFPIILLFIILGGLLIGLSTCDKIRESKCDPPEITYPVDGDSIYANHCNEYSVNFEGTAGVSKWLAWELLSGPGTISPTPGWYSSGVLPLGSYDVMVRAVNDCSPPKYDTCQFTIIADTENTGTKKLRIGGLSEAQMKFGPESVWGPEGAESLAVVIRLDGPVSLLESLGFKPQHTHDKRYMMKISVKDLELLGVQRELPRSLFKAML